VADANCTSCGTCPYPWGGLSCNYKYWVIQMRLNIDWQTAYWYKKEEFATLFAEDMGFVLNTSPSRLAIWILKGNNGGTVVYWTYTFLTGSDIQAQAEGGSIFAGLKYMVAHDGSPVYRGWVTNETDSSYALEYCIPSKEVCDASGQLNYLELFLISVGSSLGVHFIGFLIYRFATRKKRRERYEAKLREVREHQIRTMESHQRARRVGLKDVSKSRASQIYHAKQEQKKIEEKEIKDRVKEEKELQRRASLQKHKSQASQEQLEQRRSSQIDSNEGGGSAGSQAAAPAPTNPEANLPPGWQVFYNPDGIPYYYNIHSGITSWRHPNL